MRRYLVAMVGYGVLIAATTIASAIVLARLVADVVAAGSAASVERYAAPLSILLVLWMFRAVGTWLQARTAQRGTTDVIADLSQQVLRSVTALPPRLLDTRRDDAATVLTRGIDELRPYLTSYLPALFLAVILTPSTVVTIAAYDVESAVIVLIALPLVPVFMVLIGLATRDRSAAALTAMTTLQSRMLDLVAGIPTLRALDRTADSAQRIATLDAAHRRSTMATLRMAFLSAFVLELLATLGVALVAVGVGLRLVYGDMTLAAGLTALLLAPEVFWPLRRVGAEFHAAQDGKAAADKAFELIDRSPAAVGAHRAPAVRAVISLDAVTVDGRDGPAPDAVSARIPPGRVTVLPGPNGAGKSTVLQVIAGLMAPTGGRVVVGDIDLADVDRDQWWPRLAWLPQRPVLVPGTIADNLDLFGPLADVDNACRAAALDTVLATLPDGLQTTVGRDGTGLSLGERQRVALARALGSPASVLLLDEPTAHLDADSERRVLDALVARARAGATVVVVAHREPLLAIADQVIHVRGRVDATV